MSDKPTNPLFAHPAFAPVATEVGRGALGQRLAVYASARSKRRDRDPLVDLGVPILDFLLTILGDPVESVMATNQRILGPSPDAWFLTIRFADGLVATLDLGTFLPDSYPHDLELRLELCGTDRAILVEPANVAVTVIGPSGPRRDDGYPDEFDDRLRHFVAAVQADNVVSPALSVAAAARRSAAAGEVVTVSEHRK
ncbi:MAG TPA: Gfo/Idh/MocA family oxidoreductase [Thermomicrobiales bacterium]|jgi:predicted dehydrogenase